MAGALPFASVIVPVVETVGVRECVASLCAQDYPRERHEVIIVEAGGSGHAAAARDGSVIRLHEPRRNVSAARNRGIRESRGEILAFTDPDCVATTSWLRRLAEGFSDPRIGAVAGAILPFPPRTPAERYMAVRRSHTQERPLSHPERPYAMTPSLALRRDALTAAGLFDTRFPGGGWEDADLCWRLSRHTGYAIAHASRAAVFHRYRSTSRAFLVQQYHYGYGLGVLSRKYGAELPAEWRRRASSPAGVIESVLRLAGAWRRPSGSLEAFDTTTFRWFDVLRQLGQRGGYWAASLSWKGVE